MEPPRCLCVFVMALTLVTVLCYPNKQILRQDPAEETPKPPEDAAKDQAAEDKKKTDEDAAKDKATEDKKKTDEETPAGDPKKKADEEKKDEPKPEGETEAKHPDASKADEKKNDTKPAGEGGEVEPKPDAPKEEGEKKGDVQEVTASLDLDPAKDTPPENVILDKYGGPLTERTELNFTLANGEHVRVYSEIWKTIYTAPPTIPGCICITRAPLTNLKKYGNIHFKFIKVTTPRYVTESTPSGSTTPCPPCPICPDC